MRDHGNFLSTLIDQKVEEKLVQTHDDNDDNDDSDGVEEEEEDG